MTAGLFARLRKLFGGKGADAATVFESDTVRITLPPGWKRQGDRSRLSARGPEGEMLKVTAFSIGGTGAAGELAEIRAELVGRLKRTIEETAREDVFTEFSGITEEQIPAATLLFTTLRSKQGGFTFWQYGLVGARAGLYANCQFPPESPNAQPLLAALKAVQWK